MDDEFATGLLKPLIRGIYFVVRFVVLAVLEFGIEMPCWYTGWAVLRVLTLGRWPREGCHEVSKASTLTHFLVGLTGFMTLILGGALLAIHILPAL